MARKPFVDIIFKALRRFCASERGNVMITFALATVPMIGFVGASVDYSRANAAKVAMQAAVDSTALMLSKNASSLTSADLNTKASAYFHALFTRSEVSNIAVTPIFTTSGGSQIVVNATGKVATTFWRVMGQDNLNIDASSTVKWGNSRLRVALVLDVTGSMASDGKMTALKTATKNLLTQLQGAAAQNGDVYVSIIPFSKDVNVDSVNYNASWIDWTAWNKDQGTCSYSYYDTYSECISRGRTWTPKNHNTWNGCVTDRGNSGSPSSGNYDTNVTEPTTSITSTLFAAEEYGSCPAAVMPLSYNWSAMTTLINNLYPAGNTNQGIGLAHGWMSLVGGDLIQHRP